MEENLVDVYFYKSELDLELTNVYSSDGRLQLRHGNGVTDIYVTKIQKWKPNIYMSTRFLSKGAGSRLLSASYVKKRTHYKLLQY